MSTRAPGLPYVSPPSGRSRRRNRAGSRRNCPASRDRPVPHSGTGLSDLHSVSGGFHRPGGTRSRCHCPVPVLDVLPFYFKVLKRPSSAMRSEEARSGQCTPSSLPRVISLVSYYFNSLLVARCRPHFLRLENFQRSPEPVLGNEANVKAYGARAPVGPSKPGRLPPSFHRPRLEWRPAF